MLSDSKNQVLEIAFNQITITFLFDCMIAYKSHKGSKLFKY